MRIVVPFTDLHPTTKEVLSRETFQVDFVDVRGDPDSYRRLLARLWSERETVVIVEHDIVPWPGAIEEIWACPCQWGTYSYVMHGGIGIAHGFGCCKLTAWLMTNLPGLWDEPGEWSVLDQRLFFAARKVGIEPHLHRPPVTHLPRNPVHTKEIRGAYHT